MSESEIKPIKPPFSYHGGKQRMSLKIIPLLPKHTIYAEPFCGSAALFFKKPYPKITNSNHYREAINDNNQWIINFFRVLRDGVKSYELAKQVFLTPYSRTEHNRAKEIMRKNIDDVSEIEAAWSFFVNVKMSFGGVMNTGWAFSLYGENTSISRTVMVDLLPYVQRLSSVHIDNLDALHFIKNWDSPQTFFFIDPPYPKTSQGHYTGYTKDDFKKLCNVLNDSNASFVLTCYPFDGIQEILPKNIEIFKFRSFASSQKKGDKKHLKGVSQEQANSYYREEWIVRRLAKVEPREEIKKLYASGVYDCFTGDTINVEEYCREYNCEYEKR